MKLEELISKFAANAGLERVAATEGVWRFSADGNVFGVTQDDAGENVFLFGEIRASDPAKRDALIKSAMEANYFHRGTGGGTFALNPGNGELTLFESKRLEGLGEEAFYSFVERFVNALATWNGISGLAQTADSAPETSETFENPIGIGIGGGFMQV
jgi:hypothetical protein